MHEHTHLQHLLFTIDPLDIMGFIAIFSLSFASSLSLWVNVRSFSL